jgi:hypothetical protein
VCAHAYSSYVIVGGDYRTRHHDHQHHHHHASDSALLVCQVINARIRDEEAADGDGGEDPPGDEAPPGAHALACARMHPH